MLENPLQVTTGFPVFRGHLGIAGFGCVDGFAFGLQEVRAVLCASCFLCTPLGVLYSQQHQHEVVLCPRLGVEGVQGCLHSPGRALGSSDMREVSK